VTNAGQKKKYFGAANLYSHASAVLVLVSLKGEYSTYSKTQLQARTTLGYREKENVPKQGLGSKWKSRVLRHYRTHTYTYIRIFTISITYV